MFEWDEAKAKANEKKHGITFDQAVTVFEDPLAITYSDPDHSDVEDREVTIGKCEDQVLLTISHTERSGKIRLISAREATKAEQQRYETD